MTFEFGGITWRSVEENEECKSDNSLWTEAMAVLLESDIAESVEFAISSVSVGIYCKKKMQKWNFRNSKTYAQFAVFTSTMLKDFFLGSNGCGNENGNDSGM